MIARHLRPHTDSIHGEGNLDWKRAAATLVIALASGVAQVQSAPPPAPAAPLPVLLAVKAAEAALAACVADGWTATITVTDREGVARVVLMSDGTGALSINMSRRKAYTSAALGISTAQLAKNLIVLRIDPTTVDPELIAFPGGFPIRGQPRLPAMQPIGDTGSWKGLFACPSSPPAPRALLHAA